MPAPLEEVCFKNAPNDPDFCNEPIDFNINKASVSKPVDNPDPEHPERIRQYTLRTENTLRKNDGKSKPNPNVFYEYDNQPIIRTGNDRFDALYALAHDEVRLNSKDLKEIRPDQPVSASVFQAGEEWKNVWTRDISYSVQLALASVDPIRAMNSLLFKISPLKLWWTNLQIIQDTGSGGSYPISTDRVVWAIAAYELLKYLEGRNRSEFLDTAYEVITNTIEHDRKTVFDDTDGLYRGEQSFLDWREQSYPQWTWNDTIQIGISKALSTNILHYKILDIASQLAAEKGLTVESTKYNGWAGELKKRIHTKFYLNGLYSTMIFGDTCPITMQSYDLLGNALAVIYEITDDAQQLADVIAKYPHTKKISAPVIFPERKEIYNKTKFGNGLQGPYHNRAVWPFVTAYWIKAAVKAKNASVVDHGVNFLMTSAALNLSNMENFEFLDGKNCCTSINSYYQLWSDVAYLAMVQDVFFGLEVDLKKGIKFSPFITSEMRNSDKMFKNQNMITLENFSYRGKKIKVVINLPEPQGEGGKKGYYKIDKILFHNDNYRKQIAEKKYIDYTILEKTNTFEITLLDFQETPDNITYLPDDRKSNEYWSPKEPEIESITPTSEGKLCIKFTAENNVKFNIYRNGILKASDCTDTEWGDQESSDYDKNTYFYSVQAVNDKGNVSFPSQTQYYQTQDNLAIIKAQSFNKDTCFGGELIQIKEDGKFEHDEQHYKNWGDRLHTLGSSFKPLKSGNYKISLRYGNGGDIGGGITCSVKKVSIKDNDTGEVIKEGIVIMPHLGWGNIDWWDYWKESSILDVKLDSPKTYEIKIFEDSDCLNMSFFMYNLYTGGNGGGNSPYNNVNISQIRLLFVN